MTEEMHRVEKDGGVREGHPLCQENKALRKRLTELTKQLAESEEQRVILIQKMNETESELTRIRDENDSLKRVVGLASLSSRDGHAGIADSTKMNETNLNSYIGRVDPVEVDTEAAIEKSEMEFTKGRKAPHVYVGRSCEERGAADVHIANDVTTSQSDGSARGEMTMTPMPPIRECCRGQTYPGVLANSRPKGERRSGQSTPPGGPFSRNDGSNDLKLPSMSRRVPNDTSEDGNGAGSGSPGLGWRGDPVRTTTQFDPSVPTAEATNHASPEIPDSASSRECSSSVESQASNDDPSDNTAPELVEGISTVSTP
ncbi:hypothetical protein LTR12_016213 [Friedmanniomyces endolithicus]|nr:hypothetical protein LTR12_016213 [Friedmanniomyces endolithicus]